MSSYALELNRLALKLNSWCSLQNCGFKRQERKKREGKKNNREIKKTQ
jgi:hypothetical protein